MKLELKNLYKDFTVRNFFQTEKKSVLEDINLTLEESDILGLLGRNGAGKTTLLKIILGLIHPTKGSVIFSDKKDPLFGFANSNPRSFFWRISLWIHRIILFIHGRMLSHLRFMAAYISLHLKLQRNFLVVMQSTACCLRIF